MVQKLCSISVKLHRDRGHCGSGARVLCLKRFTFSRLVWGVHTHTHDHSLKLRSQEVHSLSRSPAPHSFACQTSSLSRGLVITWLFMTKKKG